MERNSEAANRRASDRGTSTDRPTDRPTDQPTTGLFARPAGRRACRSTGRQKHRRNAVPRQKEVLHKSFLLQFVDRKEIN